MNEVTPASAGAPSPFAGSEWFDPLEEAVRGQVRAFIEQLLEEELEAALGRLERSERRRHRGDDELMTRARQLCVTHLPAGTAPTSVRWVGTMTTRWASCTTATGEIRMSDRLRTMPAWVVNYVLLHELAHLVEANHGSRFWALVNTYPRAERAQGFLAGVSHADASGPSELDDVGDDPDL